jgi:NAD(P)-dependent dehydrogenase (short-subunit alcohol dehydrogenase family)
MDLDDRVAIVTGAAVGTGRAIAERIHADARAAGDLAAAATSRRAPRTRGARRAMIRRCAT